MKVMFSVDHPAWAHQFHAIVEKLRARGDEVLTLAIDKDGAPGLLDRYDIPYTLCAKSTGRNMVEKGWLFFRLCLNHTLHAARFNHAPIPVAEGEAAPADGKVRWADPLRGKGSGRNARQL